MKSNSFRRDYLTKPIFRWARKALPSLSATESEAIDAGDVWWDADLFSGHPDYDKLLDTPAPKLTEEEQAFYDGPCEKLCRMVDDWAISHEHGDLPDEVWDLMRREGFFGLIIPKKYGGRGFSAFAHSEIIRRISTRSVVAAVTVMVPNSLGPGELLLQFGTDEQRDHWLPLLADGRALPAFGLTSEQAGSDASAMIDTGVVCKGMWKGEEVTGVRLNWSKRYITLGPVATVLGLAFKLSDPDGLLSGDREPGITCALVPTDLDGVMTGRRHIPAGQMFQNGPTTGKDVFVPLDHIIGGPDYAGRGWMMLMSALAAGRGISLPSLSAAATAMAAHTSGAYARIREQFGISISKFGGIQEPLARLAAGAYKLDAARHLTCAGLDEGRKLAVVSGIMKANATERMRDAVNDAMDIHAGKAVIDGPKNYLGNCYRAIPVGITVEGANILTRNMIIFGQGAIRCHPYILKEMLALQEEDKEKGLADFDREFWAHVGHSVRTFFRAWGWAWSGSRFAPAPPGIGKVIPIYRKLSRYSAAFALTADMAFLTLGGELKRREMISARMGDVLSELYLVSAVLKRWQDEGRQEEDLPLVEYAAAESFTRIGRALDEVVANMPSRGAAAMLRFITLPGGSHRGPDDMLTKRCADILTEPSATRDRLTAGVFEGNPGDGIDLVISAYRKVIETDDLRRRLRDSKQSLQEARETGTLDADEAARLEGAMRAVDDAVAVDDFDAGLVGRVVAAKGAGEEARRAAHEDRKPEAAE